MAGEFHISGFAAQREATDGGGPETTSPLAGLTGKFVSNIPIGKPIGSDGGLFYLPARGFIIGDDGMFYERLPDGSTSDAPGLNLTADDPSFELVSPLQWQYVPDAFAIGGNLTVLEPFWFNAEVPGWTGTLDELTPVPGIEQLGGTRGRRGYTPWFVKVSDDPVLYQAYGPDGPVGSPEALQLRLPTFDTIAALRAATSETESGYATLLGYYAAGDGGGGGFRWDSTDTTTADDGGAVIVPASSGLAATGRWKRIFDDGLTPRHFGATGDGTTNDSAAIQAAITAAAATGGVVLFPPGNYIIGTGLTLASNIALRGNSTTIKMGSTFSGAALISDSTAVSNVSFNGITFDCRANTATKPAVSLTQPATSGMSFSGCSFINPGVGASHVNLAQVARIAFDRCRFIGGTGSGNTQVAIFAYNAVKRLAVTNSYIEGYLQGIDISNTTAACQSLTVSSNQFYNTGQNAIVMSGCIGASVVANTFDSSWYTPVGGFTGATAGRSAITAQLGASGINIAGNTSINGAGAMSCYGVQDVSITGNTVSDCPCNGMEINIGGAFYAHRVSVVGNRIINAGAGGSDAFVGIYVLVDDVAVIGNTVTGSQGDGIRIGSDSSHTAYPVRAVVSSNICTNNGQKNDAIWYAGISVGTFGQNFGAGSQFTISDNICTDDQATKTQLFGLQIVGSSITNPVQLSNNNFAGNSSATINNYANATIGAKLTGVLDANGNNILALNSTTNAVNGVQITNAATGNMPLLAAKGTDSNVDLTQSGQGTGRIVHKSTTVVPSTVSSALEIYNTTDQTTNYERLRAYWSANVAIFTTDAGGTGTNRALRLASPANTLNINGASSSTGGVSISAAATGSPSCGHLGASGTLAAASGSQFSIQTTPTINQSGTAGYTALLVNPSETATGSGSKLLADFQVGGSSKAKIDNTGVITAAAGTAAGSVATVDGTQTLTNKRVARRLTTINAPGATLSINTDNYDVINVTGIAANITTITPTGTPSDGDRLLIRFIDNGTARTITWTSSGKFLSSGVATLLSTTVANMQHNVSLIYDSLRSAWMCMGCDPVGY